MAWHTGLITNNCIMMVSGVFPYSSEVIVGVLCMMCVCGFVYVLAWVKFAEIMERALQTRALGPADWSPGLCRQEALVCGLLCVVYVCVWSVCLPVCLCICVSTTGSM